MITQKDIFALLESQGVKHDDVVTIHASLRAAGPIENGADGLIDGLKAAAPVCSVGNYQAYLGIGCCMCEMVPGALTFTEEWGVRRFFVRAPGGTVVNIAQHHD